MENNKKEAVNKNRCLVACILIAIAACWYAFIGIGYLSGNTLHLLFGLPEETAKEFLSGDWLHGTGRAAAGLATLKMFFYAYGVLLIIFGILSIVFIRLLWKLSPKAKSIPYVFFAYIAMQLLLLALLYLLLGDGAKELSKLGLKLGSFFIDILINFVIQLVVIALMRPYQPYLKEKGKQ